MKTGTRLGPYEILAPISAGGMGEVYKARDRKLDRDVAIKVLPEQLASDPERLRRFEKEARAASALSHPNIVTIYDIGREGAVSYLAMELVAGLTLRELLAEGPLSVKKALSIAADVSQGLARAHAAGIVHRDLKPENVMIGSDGLVKLLDFGLAKLTRPESDSGHGTRVPTVSLPTEAGVVMGTVGYMSPEQASGHPVDFRSDQFSFGSMLYEMLTGKRPFQKDSAAQTLAAIIQDEPEPLTKLDPRLPAPLGWIVQRCLSKDPEERYSSTKDLAKELQNLRTHLSEAVSATDVALVEASSLRRPVLFWALAAVAALAIALVVLLVIRSIPSGSPPASPLSLSLSFPLDAAPRTEDQNPFALSPDGKTLVYAGSDTSTAGPGVGNKLFVRRLDRDEIRPIPGTEGSSSWPRLPFFSPDGLEVAFFAEEKLKKVALAGGLPVTLCDAPNPRGGSWGPDGTIVFTPTPMSGLQRIPASGGEPRVVTTPDAGKSQLHRSPQVLPDGEHVLFQIIEGIGTRRAAVVSLRTGQQQILVEDAGVPRYLPTGHLVFTRSGSLFAVPFSLTRLETSGPPVQLLEDLVTDYAGTMFADLAFSQEGTLVYVPSRQLQRTLVWVDRKGAVEQTTFPPGGYQDVALSPDGGRLATIAVDKGDRPALLFGDFARGTLSRSTAEGALKSPAWAPDGKRIAFTFSPGGSVLGQKVFWQNADGSSPPERLTSENASQIELPTSFSPDGSLLLLDWADLGTPTLSATWKIFVLPLNGERKLHPFLQTKFVERRARFSPDGRWVTYESTESGRIDVFVRPFPGPGPKWQISTEGGGGPRWSRSGRELFYRNGDKMMVVGVATKPTFHAGRPRTLFEGHYHLSHLSNEANDYDVAPDGTRFLMIKEDPAESGPAHVNVVLNWFEEVKRRVPGAK